MSSEERAELIYRPFIIRTLTTNYPHGGTIVNNNLLDSAIHANDYMIINGKRQFMGVASLHGFSIYGNPLLTTLPEKA